MDRSLEARSEQADLVTTSRQSSRQARSMLTAEQACRERIDDQRNAQRASHGIWLFGEGIS